MKECRLYRISGRVQGVFFRASTRDTARRLGLSGWVRNLPDGRVESLACGEAPVLERFEQWLHRGPEPARVDSVEAEEVEYRPGQDFEVR